MRDWIKIGFFWELRVWGLERCDFDEGNEMGIWESDCFLGLKMVNLMKVCDEDELLLFKIWKMSVGKMVVVQ